jgi:hypothetical protein
MDYNLIGNAAILGALASLAVASLGLAATGRFTGGLAFVIALAAMAFSGWVLVDWPHVSSVPTAELLPRLGTIAGGSIVGAVAGVILPLILNAIADAMRGDVI